MTERLTDERFEELLPAIATDDLPLETCAEMAVFALKRRLFPDGLPAQKGGGDE